MKPLTVTTTDIDFLFCRTPANVRKLKAIAKDLEAVILRSYYPVSPLWRVVRDSDGLQLDFMDTIHGIRSFDGLRGRASEVRIGGVRLLVAALADIIKSKKAAGRPQDLAVLPVLKRSNEESSSHDPRRKAPKPEKG
jgi:predicted nucleotidyltransferase